MISQATLSAIRSADAATGVSVNIVPSDVVGTDGSRNIDLTAKGAWTELIREIVTTANSGGGRLIIRCIANDQSANEFGRVFSAPIESTSGLKPTESKSDPQLATAANLQPVRIVTDPSAPALQPQDVDRLYPWRQKDLLRELNRRLGRRVLNSYDIQAIRRQHYLDERPDFVFNLPGAGRRYSPAVADWIMDHHARDPEFFHRARSADHEIMKLRRQKPK